MKTRNAGTPKSAAAQKTTPAKKSTVKTPPNPPTESVTPKTAETKSASPASKGKQVKADESMTNPSPDSTPEQPVEEAKALAGADEAMVGKKGAKTTKTVVVKKTKTVLRRVPARTKTPTSAKAASGPKPKLVETEKLEVEESTVNEMIGDAEDVETEKLQVEESTANEKIRDAEDVDSAKKGDSSVSNVEESAMMVPARTKTPTSATAASGLKPELVETEKLEVEEPTANEKIGDAEDIDSAKKGDSFVSNVEESAMIVEHAVENVEETKSEEEEAQNVMNIEEPTKEGEKTTEAELPLDLNDGKSAQQENPVAEDDVESSEKQDPSMAREEKEATEETEEKMKTIDDEVEPENEPEKMEEDINKELKGEDTQPGDVCHGEERMEESRDQEFLEEFGEEDPVEDDTPQHDEEAVTLEEERMELTAAAKERKIRKELEIFVGGLERDAVEDDVKKAFEKIGEVVEVRLHKNPSSDKNKGYAFVKFATKEQASRALSEMKNPLICGKRCGTAPSEDNDTLFLGNICNTWTKEAIKQKLKDYGIEGVERITLVSDAQHEGLSRGFAFIEFACHADAMLAFKRLQKPDAIFGHPERTAKVGFAEPLREPDPEVMAQVKSVFIDGLTPHWDEHRIRERMKGYGEIARIMLARNMSTAKRKDFGFVDFTTHEAAVACIEGINNTNLGDGNSKTKVRARLSNPSPKIQAVKGGMCGGFRIGHGGAGSFSRSGRGFGRGGHAFNRPNFQRGRGFHQRGGGQSWRTDFSHQHNLGIQYPRFHRREMFGRGGWMNSFGGAHAASGGAAVPERPNFDDRGRGRHIPARRQPFPPEEGFNRPFVGGHLNDPYFYDDGARGMKRPFFMSDQDPDYMEPSRLRPRLDYADPAVPFQTPRYRDSLGGGSSFYSRDYYGSDYGEGSYSSFYGSDRPYGGGYYY